MSSSSVLSGTAMAACPVVSVRAAGSRRANVAPPVRPHIPPGPPSQVPPFPAIGMEDEEVYMPALPLPRYYRRSRARCCPKPEPNGGVPPPLAAAHCVPVEASSDRSRFTRPRRTVGSPTSPSRAGMQVAMPESPSHALGFAAAVRPRQLGRMIAAVRALLCRSALRCRAS